MSQLFSGTLGVALLFLSAIARSYGVDHIFVVGLGLSSVIMFATFFVCNQIDESKK